MLEEGPKQCKVVLLGESGVGKTCIISRFINNSFEDNVSSTTGASYAGKTMSFPECDGKSLKFEIWDTAGQEKYRALTKIFYKDAGIAILVYDITKRDSFEEIKNYWINQIRECSPRNIVIGLAANKSDLFDNEEVKEAEARKYAQEIGAVFKLTSACIAVGIDDLFRGVGRKFLNPDYNEDDEKSNNSKNNEGGGGEIQNEIVSTMKKRGSMKLDQIKTDEIKKQKKKCC